MKTSALALAVLLAASGAAFAGDDAAAIKAGTAQRADTKIELDHRSTGSVKRVVQPEASLDHNAEQGMTPGSKKLGFDVSPWMMPTIH